MELVYLWVEDYKNIQKQGFNFSPRFRCEFKSGILSINENIDYMSIFPDNINVTIIVGENGSGKSSLLNFILEQNEYSGLFIFKVKDELLIFDKNIMHIDFNIECNYKYVLNPDLMEMNKYKNGTSLLFLKSFMDINTYNMSQQLLSRRFFHFSKKIDFISELHENTVELFNIISINSKKDIDTSFKTSPYSLLALNQHFTYLKDKYLHRILKYYPDLENFISQYFKIDKVEYKLKDLGSIFLASPSFKDNYKDDKFLSNMFDIFNKEKFIENRLKILCLIFCYLEEEQLKSFILEKQVNLTHIELYELIKEENYSYIIIWNNFIEAMSVKDNYKTIIKQYLIFIKEIRREILEFSFTPSLSSGEEKLLYLFVNIYDYILSMKTSGVTKFTIIVDEPDTLLHPNWQKKILSLVVTFINTFFKDDIFNIIITTHSPFILSDLPKQNIIFLEKDDKTGDCINTTNDVDINPFGANIHTLLSHGFFMKDGLMGEFAKNKIDTAIKYLNKTKLSEDELIYCENIISIIGEPIIKRQLQKMLDSKRLSEIDLIKKQIVELQLELTKKENKK
jgi:predicted ATP-dependent endonuclease of OLD family